MKSIFNTLLLSLALFSCTILHATIQTDKTESSNTASARKPLSLQFVADSNNNPALASLQETDRSFVKKAKTWGIGSNENLSEVDIRGHYITFSSEGRLLFCNPESECIEEWDIGKQKSLKIMSMNHFADKTSLISSSNCIATQTKNSICTLKPIANLEQLLFKLALLKGKRSQDVVGLGKLANHSILAQEFDETNQEMIKEEINAHSTSHFKNTVKKAIKDNNFLDLYTLSRHPVLTRKISNLRQIIRKLRELQTKGISVKKSVIPAMPHSTGLKSISDSPQQLKSIILNHPK